jgi:hypothetical protein
VGYLFVFLIAAGVGVAVYAVTLRDAARAGAGMESLGDAPSVPAERQGDYVPVTAWGPDWQSRLTGLLGLAVAVIVGAAALAVMTYTGFSMLFKLIGSVAGS